MKNNWTTYGFGKRVSPELVTDDLLEIELVILLQGTNMFGNPVYSYIKLMGSALKEMFAKMHAGENFKPSDFGAVIAAGTGMPSKETRDEMKELYNMVDVPVPPITTKLTSFQPKFFDDENT